MILSNTYENLILDLYRGGSIPAISGFYLGLIKTDNTEVTGASYNRVFIASSTNTWFSTQGTVGEVSSGNTGTITNNAPISWGTALETWGTVDRIRFFTHPTNSTYFCDHTVTPLNITSGTLVSILANDYEISTRND